MLTISADTKDIRRFAGELTLADRRIAGSALSWAKKLTLFAHSKMRLYSKESKSGRSTGKLHAAVQNKIDVGANFVRGEAFVNGNLVYQFKQEYGHTGGGSIYGKPKMAFPVTSWRKGMSNPTLSKSAKAGFFVFSKVTRGKYKGKHFTARAFDKLMSYYTARESEISAAIGRSIVFGSSILKGM